MDKPKLIEQALPAPGRSPDQDTSLFSNLRNRASILAFATLSGLSALGCRGAKDSPQSEPSPSLSSHPVDHPAIPDAGINVQKSKIDPLNPPPEIVGAQETISPAYLYERAVFHLSKVLSYDTKEQDGRTTFFLDPYHGFEITAIATRPDGLKTEEEKQAWRNDRRLDVSKFEPTELRYRIKLDHGKELPLAATRVSSLEDTYQAATQDIKLGRKTVPLADALDTLTKAELHKTKIYRYLVDKRTEDCKKNIVELQATHKSQLAERRKLQASKDPDDVSRLADLQDEIQTTLDSITEYRKSLRHPVDYVNEFADTLVNGLIAQESQYQQDPKNKSSAKGVWQITDIALQDVQKANPRAHYKDQDRTNLARSTQIAIKYFDIIFSQIADDVEAFDQKFPEEEYSVLMPALLTAYHSGPGRFHTIVEDFLKNTPQGLTNGYDKNELQIAAKDIFAYMIIKYFHHSRYENSDRFDDESLTYALKIDAWAELMKLARQTQDPGRFTWKIASTRPSDLNIYQPPLPNEAKYIPNEEEPPRPIPSSVLILSPSAQPPVPSASAVSPAMPVPSAKTVPLPSAKPVTTQAPIAPEAQQNAAPKPIGKSLGLKDFIPETTALTHNTHVFLPNSPVGPITITSAFMEESTHSFKRYPMPAIFGDGHMEVVPPGHINLGIDYTIPDSNIKVWYGGKIVKMGIEVGYGRRITIATDVTYRYKGHDYQVEQAYAHMASFAKKLKAGSKVHHGDFIGIMGGSSTNGVEHYAHHVDLRTTIQVPDKKGQAQTYDLSLNALENQLKEK